MKHRVLHRSIDRRARAGRPACIAASGSARTAGPTATSTAQAAAAAYPAPKVPNAAAIKAKYGGQSITFIGDSVGGSYNRDVALAKRFTKDTGIKVKVVPHPTASDASYSQLARVFSSKSSSFDVAMLDVLWPGAFAPFLVDLKPKLGKEAKQHTPGLITNDTVKGSSSRCRGSVTSGSCTTAPTC